jgi:hypothetical protein
MDLDFSPPIYFDVPGDKMVHSVGLNDTSEPNWIADLMGDRKPFLKSEPEIFSAGGVQRIDIPDGWSKSKHFDDVVTDSSYDEFVPDNYKGTDCRIEFYRQGRDIPPQEAQAFKNILAAADHDLSKEEIKSIGSVLDNKRNENEFRLDRGWTETLNGKKVLLVEGQFLEDGRKNLSMIFDGNGRGSLPQEVTLIAPPEQYAANRGEMIRSLSSIVWKR